jgi:hypothetical protein
MSYPQPPRIPKWFLDHFTSGSHREALIGDLDEQFTYRQSAFWYLRQVLAAILIGVVRDVREHKVLAARAAMMSFVLVLAWVEFTWWLYLSAATKWIDPRVNDSPVLAALLFWYGPLTELWCLGCLAMGWLVGRLHREHLAAMVMVSVIAQLPLTFWWGWPWWLRAFEEPAVYCGPNCGPMRLFALMCLVGMPLCTVIGGLSAARRVPLKRHVRQRPLKFTV